MALAALMQSESRRRRLRRRRLDVRRHEGDLVRPFDDTRHIQFYEDVPEDFTVLENCILSARLHLFAITCIFVSTSLFVTEV